MTILQTQCLQRAAEWRRIACKAAKDGNTALVDLANEHVAFFLARADQ